MWSDAVAHIFETQDLQILVRVMTLLIGTRQLQVE